MTRYLLNRPLRRRAGFTLIEMLATLGVLMVLGLASAKLLTSVTDIGLQAGKNKIGRAMVGRLAADFRADVAQADDATIVESNNALEIRIDDLLVRYEIDVTHHSIDRVATKDGQAVSRERYELTPRCDPAFEVQDNIISLLLTSPEQANPWSIEAVKP